MRESSNSMARQVYHYYREWPSSLCMVTSRCYGYRGLEDDEGVHTMESEEDEFAAIQRNTEILKSVSDKHFQIQFLKLNYHPKEKAYSK